jgi:hypothetical protein
VFVYLIARGHKMQENNVRAAQAQAEAQRQYIQSVAGSSASTADEITRLNDLKARGVLTEAEFQAAKTKALNS